jgi:hypothetical protein
VTKWERFGDDTWINIDHVEVVRVEEHDDGQWTLSAAFASGRTYPLGVHEDRELLAECTDVVLRGQASDVVRAAAATEREQPVHSTEPEESIAAPEVGDSLAAMGLQDPAPIPAANTELPAKRGWRFWRPSGKQSEVRNEVDPLPAS